uniref:Sodium/potassium/calcium exchanger 6, mitochondrial n=1 Tax=Phallusia mammillata TaxID=59560 RepID=A0A6F9DTZ4_9ASCI|nr:sodium/potassium/calcium exchanger 6, mitochondrial [Phallusia mammillata]
MKHVTAFLLLSCYFLSSNANVSFSNNTVTSLPSPSSNLGTSPLDIECRDYHKLHNSSLWCNFINTTDNCRMDEGFINYIYTAFCKFDIKYLPLIATLYAIWLIFLFVGLGTSAEGFFCPSLEYIAHNLNLSQNIAGLTIVAFGNGAPDLFSAFAAFNNSNATTTGVAIGALLGAAMLLTTVVAGLVATTHEFTIAERPFMRDMVFFIASSFWTFYILYNGEIKLMSSVGFLIFYIFYVLVVVVGRYINQRNRAKMVAKLEREKAQQVINTSGETSTIADENTPLISSPNTSARNTNNNNADREADWTDVKLRTNSWNNEKHVSFNVPDEQKIEDSESSLEKILEGDVDVDFAGKSMLYVLLVGLRPFSASKWAKSGFIKKTVMFMQVPWKVFCHATIPLVGIEANHKRWNRPLNCLSLLISPPLCVFATKGGHVMIGGVFPVWALLLIIGALFAAIVWFTSSNTKSPPYQWVFAYTGFVVAIILTYTIANEIVNLIQTFGTMLNLTNVIMGLTFLAWGNSIGDVIADVTLARQGYPRMSMSACYGGPLFNLLIGLGLPCTVHILRTNKPILVKFTHLEAVICGGLLFSLCTSFVLIPIRKFRITPSYGYLLLLIYAVFLLVSILAGVGVI